MSMTKWTPFKILSYYLVCVSIQEHYLSFLASKCSLINILIKINCQYLILCIWLNAILLDYLFLSIINKLQFSQDPFSIAYINLAIAAPFYSCHWHLVPNRMHKTLHRILHINHSQRTIHQASSAIAIFLVHLGQC